VARRRDGLLELAAAFGRTSAEAGLTARDQGCTGGYNRPSGTAMFARVPPRCLPCFASSYLGREGTQS
jgi:hypothetical protein